MRKLTHIVFAAVVLGLFALVGADSAMAQDGYWRGNDRNRREWRRDRREARRDWRRDQRERRREYWEDRRERRRGYWDNDDDDRWERRKKWNKNRRNGYYRNHKNGYYRNGRGSRDGYYRNRDGYYRNRDRDTYNRGSVWNEILQRIPLNF